MMSKGNLLGSRTDHVSPAEETASLNRLLSSLQPDNFPETDPSDFPNASERLGRDAVAWAIRLAEMVGVRTGPIGRQPSSPLGTVAMALENTAVQFLLAFASDQIPSALTANQMDLIRVAVQQNIPYQELGDGFRRLQRRWIAHLTEQIKQHRLEEERMVLTERLIARGPSFFDAHIDTVIAEYLRQCQQRVSNEAADLQNLVFAILRGELVPERVEERIGLPFNGHHTGLVLWFDSEYQAYAREMAEIARVAAFALGCPYHLLIPGEAGKVLLWLTRTTPFPDDVRTRLAAVIPADGSLRLAFSADRPGAEGFRRVHYEAQEAARVARQTLPYHTVIDYSDVRLLALLTQNPELARWFIQDELGGLAAPGQNNRDLRRTLSVYMANRSQVRTAQELFLHRNSVGHRLRRAEALIGHSLNVRSNNLIAALVMAEALDIE